MSDKMNHSKQIFTLILFLSLSSCTEFVDPTLVESFFTLQRKLDYLDERVSELEERERKRMTLADGQTIPFDTFTKNDCSKVLTHCAYVLSAKEEK